MGEIKSNGIPDIDREDARDYPEYDTDEYYELTELGGRQHAYDLRIKESV